MTIKVYSGFSKLKNSTKQPTGGTDVSAVLKAPCGILNPVFEISSGYSGVNYVYVASWSRYYFVTECEYITNDIIRLHCAVDVLASYKSSIGSYTAFVSRAASSYDTDLHDDAISQEQEYVQETEGARTTLTASVVKTGAYIVRTVGYSGVTSFIATEAELYQLLKYAFDQTNWDPNSGTWYNFFGDTMAAAYCNPFQYIVDVRWIALTDTQVTNLIGRPVRRVYLGYFDTGLDLPKIDPISSYYPTSLEWQDVSIAVPAAYYNDFRDYDASWVSYELNVPGCGTHPIDPIAVKSGISMLYGVDVMTGDVIAEVYQGTADPARTLLYKTSGSIGVPIQIGQVSAEGTAQLSLMQPIKSGGGLAKVVGSQINRGVSEMIGGTVGSLSAVVSAVTGDKVNMIGSIGARGCAQLDCDAYITKRLLKSKDLQTTTYGRPLCQNTQLSSLSGFVLCNNAAVSISGLDSERDAVNGYLNSGFYYE